NQVIHNDLNLPVLRAHALHLCTLFARRKIQLQAFYVNRIDMFGRTKKIADSHMKPELCNIHDGLKSRFVTIRIRLAENPEAAARNLETLDWRDVERMKLNLAFEPGRQCLNNHHAQCGFG